MASSSEAHLDTEPETSRAARLALNETANGFGRAQEAGAGFQPYSGRPALQNDKSGWRKRVAICHAARKGRYTGSHWLKPVAPPIYLTSSVFTLFSLRSVPTRHRGPDALLPLARMAAVALNAAILQHPPGRVADIRRECAARRAFSHEKLWQQVRRAEWSWTAKGAKNGPFSHTRFSMLHSLYCRLFDRAAGAAAEAVNRGAPKTDRNWFSGGHAVCAAAEGGCASKAATTTHRGGAAREVCCRARRRPGFPVLTSLSWR